MGTGLVDFFTLEAGEYLERLDGLLAQAGGGPPALDPFLTDARALRGSATMARQEPIADLAGALERLAKALRDSAVPWDAAVRGAVIAAVDDLKILVRAVRNWSGADDERAQARTHELTQLAPARARRSSGVMASGSFVYIASEAGELAAALHIFTQNPSQSPALLSALPRVRALRGMVSLRDLPPLADVVEAVEDVAKVIELGTGTLGSDQLALLRSAAALLQRSAIDLRSGGQPDPAGAEAHQFAIALDTVLGESRTGDDVIPIAALFHADAGPHVVSATPHPPTTPAQRFRIEVVSQAEHLQRLVDEARAARDDTARTRAGRGLRGALHAVRATAVSFGESDVAKFVENTVGAAAALDTLALAAIGEAAKLLANPRTDSGQLAGRLRTLAAGRSVDTAIGAGFSPVSRGTPTSVTKTEPHLATMLGAQRSVPPADSVPSPSPAPASHSAPTSTPAAVPQRVTLAPMSATTEDPVAATPSAAAPAPAPAPRPSRATPLSLTAMPPSGAPSSGAARTGADLHALLASGIAGLTRLDDEPFSPPAHIEDESVPIDEFFYRGRAALDRALELRETIRKRGGEPDSAEIEELFALLELAATD